MAEIKTKITQASAKEFLQSVPDEQKRKDSLALLKLFSSVTNEKPKMWGISIVGFGSYHYKSERSKQEGEWPLVGFSPRKQNLTLYIIPGFDGMSSILKKLGKHKTSVGCLYINKLEDVDLAALEQLIAKAYTTMKKKYAVSKSSGK